MASEIELGRSPEARRRAERALVALLDGIERSDPEIIVLGGLVPEVLVNDTQWALVRPRLDVDALIALDSMPVWLSGN